MRSDSTNGEQPELSRTDWREGGLRRNFEPKNAPNGPIVVTNATIDQIAHVYGRSLLLTLLCIELGIAHFSAAFVMFVCVYQPASVWIPTVSVFSLSGVLLVWENLAMGSRLLGKVRSKVKERSEEESTEKGQDHSNV
jgi:hypothetical protein